MEAFHAYLHDRLLNKKLTNLQKDLIRTWNRIVSDNGLNYARLTFPKDNLYVSAPLSAYPESLQQDIDRYLDRLTQPELFAEHSLDKPLRPMTIRNITAHIRQLLDAAVIAGCKRDQFRTLADLVNIEVLGLAFRAISERIGNNVPATLHNISATILAIGRHHVGAPQEILDKIDKEKRRLASRIGNSRPEMTARNMARLAQFDDPTNVRRLIDLPNKLMKQAEKNPGSSRAALKAMHSVTIAILLAHPMRAGNLASLDIDRHLTVRKKGTHRLYSVRVEGSEVKNGAAIDFDLNATNSRLVSRYLDLHRQYLSQAAGSALFPRRSGGTRDPGRLGEELKNAIWRETGLIMNAHLFRHLAGMLFLERQPGEYETVRRLLGHKKLETTMGYYARFDSKAAAKRYDDVVLSTFGKSGDVL
jgi:integrase